MKVLLVDDHPLILSALKAMMESIKPGVQVTALSSGSATRRSLAVDHDYDLVLLDLQLGDALGFELLGELRRSYPDMPVVVISASDRSSDVIQAIDLGAMGFLPKRMSTEGLSDALRLVMDGGIFVPTMSLGSTHAAEAPVAEPSDDDSAYQTLPSFERLGLTPRQADVLSMLLQGKPNKDIARRLGLSVETVKDHVQAVLRALGVSSRTQAVLAVGQMTRQRRAPAAE
ncbi:MAG TPA: response regulator transcription factor [Ideonella sp.]|uniref:response regulator transcription factor n=1 Tax=Ideonella sp. TaxID=1929293 RepID=UPI002C6D3A9F|nr:response regulator transcription factor [Ideonella sp.]HSI47309.1 response regulator transcription factor [Ideonella sp.]